MKFLLTILLAIVSALICAYMEIVLKVQSHIWYYCVGFIFSGIYWAFITNDN